MPEWSKGCDLSSHGASLAGSNPVPDTLLGAKRKRCSGVNTPQVFGADGRDRLGGGVVSLSQHSEVPARSHRHSQRLAKAHLMATHATRGRGHIERRI